FLEKYMKKFFGKICALLHMVTKRGIWYTDNIKTAWGCTMILGIRESRGVMSATSSTTLSPKTTITRAQLAKMLKLMMEKTAK
ncbi:MAG: hypothetical protein LUE11_00900, partial [Clostridia bacterium]|nr:hypothetical protein [Clostridia bacterium]